MNRTVSRHLFMFGWFFYMQSRKNKLLHLRIDWKMSLWSYKRKLIWEMVYSNITYVRIKIRPLIKFNRIYPKRQAEKFYNIEFALCTLDVPAYKNNHFNTIRYGSALIKRFNFEFRKESSFSLKSADLSGELQLASHRQRSRYDLWI